MHSRMHMAPIMEIVPAAAQSSWWPPRMRPRPRPRYDSKKSRTRARAAPARLTQSFLAPQLHDDEAPHSVGRICCCQRMPFCAVHMRSARTRARPAPARHHADGTSRCQHTRPLIRALCMCRRQGRSGSAHGADWCALRPATPARPSRMCEAGGSCPPACCQWLRPAMCRVQVLELAFPPPAH